MHVTCWLLLLLLLSVDTELVVSELPLDVAVCTLPQAHSDGAAPIVARRVLEDGTTQEQVQARMTRLEWAPATLAAAT